MKTKVKREDEASKTETKTVLKPINVFKIWIKLHVLFNLSHLHSVQDFHLY
ncbi:hypothetical protein HanRHA438_Chr06g0277771 [Helianthus annuus]|nr:hypothetical protein HanRHA438_Chr06g0277771 [Helianthus annuus]